MPLAITETEINRILRDTPFAQVYGFRLHSLADGECTLDVPFQAAFERPDGKINGSVYMTAADVAMWFAIMTQIGNKTGAVTVEVNYHRLEGGGLGSE